MFLLLMPDETIRVAGRRAHWPTQHERQNRKGAEPGNQNHRPKRSGSRGYIFVPPEEQLRVRILGKTANAPQDNHGYKSGR